MNRSIHFRASDVWIEKASNRASQLGLDLSEYIRSTISKDCEEENNMEKFLENKILEDLIEEIGLTKKIENINNLSQEFKENTKTILNYLLSAEEKLIQIIENNKLIDRKVLSLLQWNNIAIELYPSGNMSLTFFGKRIPKDPQKLGRKIYEYDELSHAYYISNIDLIKLANKIADYLGFFEEKIKELVHESKNVIEGGEKWKK